MDLFVSNFKLLIQYICRIGSMEKDCPMNTTIMDLMIQYLFNDRKISSQLMQHFRASRASIDTIYIKKGSSFKDALVSRDRSIFKHLDLFPSSMREQYGTYITWFSTFLEARMKAEHAHYVWIYLDTLNRQA